MEAALCPLYDSLTLRALTIPKFFDKVSLIFILIIYIIFYCRNILNTSLQWGIRITFKYENCWISTTCFYQLTTKALFLFFSSVFGNILLSWSLFLNNLVIWISCIFLDSWFQFKLFYFIKILNLFSKKLIYAWRAIVLLFMIINTYISRIELTTYTAYTFYSPNTPTQIPQISHILHHPHNFQFKYD